MSASKEPSLLAHINYMSGLKQLTLQYGGVCAGELSMVMRIGGIHIAVERLEAVRCSFASYCCMLG